MDASKTDRYYVLLEQLVSLMTQPEHFEREKFLDTLKEICILFNISKGVTEFYRSLLKEKQGEGEILCDYDNGHGDKVILRKRFISKSRAVIQGTLYIAEDTEPPTEEELAKIDIVLRAVLSFVSRNRLATAVEQLTLYDNSGYPNLNSYFRYIDVLIERGETIGHTAVLFNLRHFSLINQEIGRQAGDTVMRSYFEMLKAVIGEQGIICRMGGDNFVAFFSNDCTQPVLDILRGIPVLCGDDDKKRVKVSASAGFFVVSEDFEFKNAEMIMERIIAAMNSAKRSEDDQFVFFDEKMLEERSKLIWIKKDFSIALTNDEFKVFYQPKVNIRDGSVVGAEALCRWVRDGRIIPPVEFIPILEQGSEICRLDFRMLSLVCRDIKRRLSQGKKVVRISVNFSRKHLVDEDLLEKIMKIVDESGVPHEYIEIEQTETASEVGFDKLTDIVSKLREEGICISVDDFGMGYSSLNLLRSVPWNVLKIDKCFLPDDSDSPDSPTSIMYKYVVSMSKELGLECITEGVETKRQIEILKQTGCDIAQGFYFDKPLPTEEFEKRLDEGRYSTDNL